MPSRFVSVSRWMRRVNRRCVVSPIITFLCCGGFTTVGLAQEALRESLAGEKAAAVRKEAIERQTYNLQTGPLRLSLGASLGVELNDNVRYTESDTAADVILEPRVNTRLLWPVTEANAFSATIGVGYRKYVFHNEFDYFLLEPGSELVFDLFVKDIRLTAYDRFSYSLDPFNAGAVSGAARYGGLQNTAGVDAVWDLNKVILSAGYGHLNFVSGVSDYDYLDRASELFTTKAQFLASDMVSFGPEATATLTRYNQPILENSFGYSAGLFLKLRPNEHMDLTLHGGYVNYRFDPRGINESPPNVSTYYFDATLSHAVNERIAQELSGGREVRPGIYSNYEDYYQARYSIRWNVIHRTPVVTRFFYENGRQPSYSYAAASSFTIFLGESYERYGAEVLLSRQIMDKLNAAISYRYVWKGSGRDLRNYQQNSLRIDLTYRF